MTLSPLPAPRVAYHADGSILYAYQHNRTAPVELSAAQAKAVNGHAAATINPSAWTQDVRDAVFILAFPVPVDLRGIYMAVNFKFPGEGGPFRLWTNADSTNGLDGTWVSREEVTAYPLAFSRPHYRSPSYPIVPLAHDGVRAIRLWSNGSTGPRTSTNANTNLLTLHIYANTPMDPPPNRLHPWDPAVDAPLGAIEFGNTPRTGVKVRSLRFKNLSTQTANAVTAGLDISGNSTPSMLTQVELSLDGITYGPTVSLGNLPPGGISQIVYARLTVDASTALGMWSPIVIPTVGSWS
jgi:hypothetical protein